MITPTSQELREELKRVRYKHRFRSVVRSTLYTLVVVAAIAVLVATLWMPVLQTYGDSMSPTLHDGEILISVKTGDFKTGDLVAFYSNNKLLIKRLIAGPSDWVNIDENGNIYVNGELLDEPYLTEKAFGNCDITLPHQVTDGYYFFMGDNRSVSMDSRLSSVGDIATEQIVGKLVFRVWPLRRFGSVTLEDDVSPSQNAKAPTTAP